MARLRRGGMRPAEGGPSGRVDPLWPLLSCRTPLPAAWELSGYGSVFVARRQPDGREAWVRALLSLSAGGLDTLTVGRAAPPGNHREQEAALDRLEEWPPSVAAPPELAAQYLYGVCACAFRALPSWPEDALVALRLLPAPRGDAVQWRRGLIGPGGLAPRALLEALPRRPPGLPEDRDPFVFTRGRVRLGEARAEAVARRLLQRQEPPLFAALGRSGARPLLGWVEAASGPTEIAEGLPRPDAERSGAPRLLPPPGRQVKGYIRLEDGAADVQALALAWASVLVGALAWASGVPPALVRAEWREPPSDADAVGVIDIRVPDGDP